MGNGRKKAIRRYVHLAGLGRSDVRYVVHNNSYINAVRALYERLYRVKNPVPGGASFVAPPQPNPEVFNARMKDFRQKVLSVVDPVLRMSHQQFVESSPSHKKAIYRAARLEIVRTGVPPNAFQVVSFIKNEKIKLKDDDPVPRLISPRNVRANVIFGSYIRPAEKAIYKAINDVYGRPTVVSGQNAHQIADMIRGAWDELHEPVAISLDLSRMDQHVSDVALKYEFSFYTKMYRQDPTINTLRWCLERMIVNKCVMYTSKNGFDVKVAYEKLGSRMSGDMNTSLGNKLLMCSLLYSYFHGHLGLIPRLDFNVVDNGDDCVVILSRSAHKRYKQLTEQTTAFKRYAFYDPANPSRVFPGRLYYTVAAAKLTPSAWFLEMGFTLKVEGIVSKFEHIDFCQTRPCFIDGKWLMVRGLAALSKDTYCLKAPEYLKKWMGQVRTGGLNTYGSVPLYSAFYKCFPEYNGKRDNSWLMEGTGMYYLSQGMTSSGVVSDANRIAFYETFGVTPWEQVLIEQHYNSLQLGYGEDNNFGRMLPI